jgi:uncharacterized membrane protein HdeD (DUF308 family)
MKMPEYTNYLKYSDILKPKWLWPGTLAASALIMGLLFFADLHTSLRPIVALWFLLVCPGMAIVRIFDVQELVLEWVLAIALSISLAGIISIVMIYTATWSPAVGLLILIGLTIAGVIIQILLNLRIILWPTSEVSMPLGRIKNPAVSQPLERIENPAVSQSLEKTKNPEIPPKAKPKSKRKKRA